MTWVIPKLWSRWDQICASEAGWCIVYWRGFWTIDANGRGLPTGKRFKDGEAAREWVSKQADMGSRRHQRAIHAVVWANLTGLKGHNFGEWE